jgi:hypothetical protein
MKSAIGLDLFLMNNHNKENIPNTYIALLTAHHLSYLFNGTINPG